MSHCNNMIALIAAVDQQGVIGRDNAIPWRLRADLVKLKNLTMDQVVILGRKTYDSMVGYYDRSGRQMPGKVYIVVTRNERYTPARANATVVHSIDEAVKAAGALSAGDILCIGGEQIFQALLPQADRVYLTKVAAEIAGDAHFPVLDPRQWREVSNEHHAKDEMNQYEYDMVVLDRV